MRHYIGRREYHIRAAKTQAETHATQTSYPLTRSRRTDLSESRQQSVGIHRGREFIFLDFWHVPFVSIHLPVPALSKFPSSGPCGSEERRRGYLEYDLLAGVPPVEQSLTPIFFSLSFFSYSCTTLPPLYWMVRLARSCLCESISLCVRVLRSSSISPSVWRWHALKIDDIYSSPLDRARSTHPSIPCTDAGIFPDVRTST